MKRNKKYKLWEDFYFDPIYATNLFIYVYEDEKKMTKFLKKFFNYNHDLSETNGVLLDRKVKYALGLYKPNLSWDVLVHELVHLRQFVFEKIGMYDDVQKGYSYGLMEAEAYFTSAVFQQVALRIQEHVLHEKRWLTTTEAI